MKNCLYLLIGLIATANATGSPSKPIKKDVIGCEPNRLMFKSFDDNRCTKLTKNAPPLSTAQVTDLTRDKCIPFNSKFSFKAKCDMMTDDPKKLKEIEIKYYKDNKCRDSDGKRLGKYESAGKMEYTFNKCMPHPFDMKRYTKMEPTQPGSLIAALIILSCCCCCICLAVCLCRGGSSDDDEHHTTVVHEEHVIVEHHVEVEHHSDRSR